MESRLHPTTDFHAHYADHAPFSWVCACRMFRDVQSKDLQRRWDQSITPFPPLQCWTWMKYRLVNFSTQYSICGIRIYIYTRNMFNGFLQCIYPQSLTVWRFYTSLLEIWIFYLQVRPYNPANLAGHVLQAVLSQPSHRNHQISATFNYHRHQTPPCFETKKKILKSFACASLSEKTENALASDFGCLGCLSWNTWQPREHSHAPPCLTSKRGVLHVNESMCLPQWWFSGRMPLSKAEVEAFLSIVFRTSLRR